MDGHSTGCNSPQFLESGNSLIKSDALQRLSKLNGLLNEPGMLRAKLGPQSDAVVRLRDIINGDGKVDLIFYWGAFYKRNRFRAEESLIRYLEDIRAVIAQELEIVVKLNVLFTDTHARLNFVSDAQFSEYFDVMKSKLPYLNWTSELLSSLVPPKADISSPVLDPILGYDRIVDLLVKQAKKIHPSRESVQGIAETYFSSNVLESAYVLKKFPEGIFLNTGLPEVASILPSMPKLHIYSGPNKRSDKPWFTKD